MIYANPNPSPLWLHTAIDELGVSEIPGEQSNKRIELYQSFTPIGELGDDIPWCADFVNWNLIINGYNGTKSKLARKFLEWGIAINEPIPGAILVFMRGEPWQGHVTFFMSQDKDGKLFCLGGNQRNKVSIDVYNPAKLLGIRWPSNTYPAFEYLCSIPGMA